MEEEPCSSFLRRLGDASSAAGGGGGVDRAIREILDEPSTPPISGWMPGLVSRLFVPEPEETGERALGVVRVLAEIDDARFSPIIAGEVKKIACDRGGGETPVDDGLHISPGLVRVWIHQLCSTGHVGVHADLMDAYEAVARGRRRAGISKLVLPDLVRMWKELGSANSIVAIRCAALYLSTAKICGDAAFELGKDLGATDLLLELIRNGDDPLSQLSVLDLFPRVFRNAGEIPPAQRAWMSQKDVTTTVVRILEDPIVGGAAMQYLALAAQFEDPHVLPTLLNFIRSVGPTTNESERLQVIHALSYLSQHSSEILGSILQDGELRCAWWDVTRTSVPKLKAAILSSIAQTLGNPGITDAPLLLRLYSLIGPDNSAGSTTAWLLQKFATGPMPELRIAAFAAWTSLARIPGGCTLLATSGGFVDLMANGTRESSHDARSAKFELLESFLGHSGGFLPADIAKKLEENLALGPHGMKTQRWDVAAE